MGTYKKEGNSTPGSNCCRKESTSCQSTVEIGTGISLTRANIFNLTDAVEANYNMPLGVTGPNTVEVN